MDFDNVQTLEFLCILRIIKALENVKKVSNSDLAQWTNFRHLLRISGHQQDQHLKKLRQNANLWHLAEWTDCTVLTKDHCADFLDDSKNQIFQLILNSELHFDHLSKVYLGSSGLASGSSKGSFLYESISEDVLLADLKQFFIKCPNLSDLTLDSFCNDDILVEAVGQHCKKLKKLVLILNPLTCPDKTRLTDDGLIDFIEDSKAVETLEILHLDQAIAAEITPKSLSRLNKMSNLKELGVNFDVFALHPQLVSHYNIQLPMIKVLKMSFSLQWTYKTEIFPDIFANVEHLQSKSLDYPWPSKAIGPWKHSVTCLRTNGKLSDFPKILSSFQSLCHLILELEEYDIASLAFWNILKEQHIPSNKLKTLTLASPLHHFRYENIEHYRKDIIATFQAKLPNLKSMTLCLLEPHLSWKKCNSKFEWLRHQKAPVVPVIKIVPFLE